MSWTATIPDKSAAPDSTPTPKRVRCPLNTVSDVRAEMAKVYREARSGLLPVEHASKYAHILATIRQAIVGDDVFVMAARVAALEAQAQRT